MLYTDEQRLCAQVAPKRMAVSAPPSQEHFSLSRFQLSDMICCGRRLRSVGEGSVCMEDAAQGVVDYLRASLVGDDETGPSCALVRCFKTHPLRDLPADLAAAAIASLGGTAPRPDTPCLTLLASGGDLPEWNGRSGSKGHRAIPLASVEAVERAPMIARLIEQMGLRPHDVLRPAQDFLLDAEARTFNVFHVPDALGSSYVPGQDFVRQHGISSVLGFGGLLPSGDFFAVILFSRTLVTREAADMFRTVALSTKLVLLPFMRGPVFREEVGRVKVRGDAVAAERQRAEIATLHLLIPALEDVALQQTAKLEHAVEEAQQRTEEVRLLNAALERRVGERTADLTATNEELKAFSFSVSHDLRAPLRSIDGFSVALEEDCAAQLDDVGRRHLQRIRAGAQRMGLLIDAMLGLSRVTRAELVRCEVNLSTIAVSLADELLATDPSRVVQFIIQPGLAVEGDPQLLRAMLQNLLGNAFKFTGRTAAPVIRVGWSEEKDAFFVSDNGAGFDPAGADKLFRAFSRLHGSDQFEGSGVGLATVARIMRRHGGSVWATAAVGEGATFWFRFDRLAAVSAD